MNAKVFHLTSGVNGNKILVEHESYKCKCKLNQSVCKSNQKWNNDECRCECKEPDDWSSLLGG